MRKDIIGKHCLDLNVIASFLITKRPLWVSSTSWWSYVLSNERPLNTKPQFPQSGSSINGVHNEWILITRNSNIKSPEPLADLSLVSSEGGEEERGTSSSFPFSRETQSLESMRRIWVINVSNCQFPVAAAYHSNAPIHHNRGAIHLSKLR